MASLLAKDRGSANVYLDRFTSLGHAIRPLHTNEITHIRAFNELAIIGPQGPLKSHGGFLGKLLHHRRTPNADGTSRAQVADVVGF